MYVDLASCLELVKNCFNGNSGNKRHKRWVKEPSLGGQYCRLKVVMVFFLP